MSELPEITDFLRRTVELGGSDLHLAAGAPPAARVNGSLVPLAEWVLEPAAVDRPDRGHPERSAAGHPAGGLGTRLRAASRGRRPVPRQRPHRARPSRGGVPLHPGRDPGTRHARPPRGRPRIVPVAPRPGVGHRHHRLRQIHHPGRDDPPHLRNPLRRDHHHRGPDRVRVRTPRLHRQTTRGRHRYPRLSARPAPGLAPRPRCHRGLRIARPRDDPHRPDRRRNRPPRARHPAHRGCAANDRTFGRRLPLRPTTAGDHPDRRACSKAWFPNG